MSDLETLYEMYAHRDLIALQKQSALEDAMKPVQWMVDEINANYAAVELQAAEQIAELEAKVKADALNIGSTINGAHLMVVWSKGRVTWDGKKLDGMMALIPALGEARKEGEPTVSIRKVGKE